MAEAVRTPTSERIVLFDGVCNFCDGAVRWLLDRDPQGRLRFAPLQGATAARLRARHPEIPVDIDTMVLVETDGDSERVYLRSDAVLRVLEVVGAAPGWRRLAAKLPRALRELGYRLFARSRYALFGRLDACRVPTPGERARFLA